MKIALTGASGFIASSLKRKFNSGEYEFYTLNRNDADNIWRTIITKADVVINLAGAPVIQRWNTKTKKTILKSRIETTRRLISNLNSLSFNQKKLLISASAIGIYPDKGNQISDEESKVFGKGFLTEVVKQWENEANKLNNKNVRLVIPRIGVVLGRKGGLIKSILPFFNKGLGGKIASGKQALSFIHIDDIVNAFQYFIENKNTQGVYNLVAPIWISNYKFTKALGKKLNKPTIIPIPSIALKLIYGKAAVIMINGEKVIPSRLLNEGFEFQYPNIEIALSELFSN